MASSPLMRGLLPIPATEHGVNPTGPIQYAAVLAYMEPYQNRQTLLILISED
jgi:hypothetical protein